MKTVLSILLLLIPVLCWGQTFDAVVNFDLELSSLDDPAEVRKAVTDGRIVILEGLMGEMLRDESGPEARIWVTMVSGSWIGTSEVRAYSCRILFSGNQWLDVFPAVRPESPSSEYVPPGSRLLMAARITGYDSQNGTPLGEIVDYRLLE